MSSDGDYRVRGLQKLRGLRDEQFAVMRKYACVGCERFGFNIMSRLWECEFRFPLVGESCKYYVANVNLRSGGGERVRLLKSVR
jgi:hypothetical protein